LCQPAAGFRATLSLANDDTGDEDGRHCTTSMTVAMWLMVPEGPVTMTD
jgi:hypothetical protein